MFVALLNAWQAEQPAHSSVEWLDLEARRRAWLDRFDVAENSI